MCEIVKKNLSKKKTNKTMLLQGGTHGICIMLILISVKIEWIVFFKLIDISFSKLIYRLEDKKRNFFVFFFLSTNTYNLSLVVY